MENTKPSFLRQRAGQLLENIAYDSKKLVLIHTAVALGVFVLATVLNYIFTEIIADTGGLSGVKLRTNLSTAQTFLDYIVSVILPFWQIGLIFAALRWARGETATVRDLLEGFRHCGKALGLRIIKALACLALALVVFNLVAAVYVMTPSSAPLVEFIQPLAETVSSPSEMLSAFTPEQLEALMTLMKPLAISFCAVYGLLVLFLLYVLRFAAFAVMDGRGAISSLFYSLWLSFKNFGKLIRLDLSFWWFYLLQVLITVVSVVGMALLLLLSVSPVVSIFPPFGLGMLCLGLLLWQYQGKVLTSYALLYDAISDRPQTQE